jgi:PKD repeat protein/formylmethanofuran dehydrogenase subunit C
LSIASGKQLNLYLLSTLTFSNLGTIAGPGILDLRAYGGDKTLTFGTITAPIEMWISASEASRTISLGANANFGSTLSLWSSHATNTLTLSHGTNYQLTVAGEVALSNRIILSQGSGAWSFGIYHQYGTSSVFDQNGALTISGTFTQSSGTFTQGGPLTVNGEFAQSGGVFTGSDSYVFTAYGNITHSGTAIVTTHVLRLRMMGEGSTLNGTDEYRLAGLQVSANVTITNSNTTTYLAYNAVASYLTVDAGKTLTIPSGKQLWAYFTPTFTYTNSGTIAGTGILNLRPFGMNSTIIFGTITAPVYMWIASSDSSTFSLGSNTIFGSNLSLWSSNTSGWITLSHGNNYSLEVIGGVGLGVNSILNQGTGKWSFGYYLQNGAGSDFIQGGELDIAGDFTQIRGTLHTGGYNITIDGNWSSKDSYVDSLVVNGTASYLSIASEAIVVNMAANYTEIPGTSNFSGPSNVMIEAPNGDYLGFVREGESHVGVGDYAVMNLYRSTDEGVTWSYERTLVNETNRDVRNYASGVTQTGRIFIFYIIYDVDTGTWPNAQYYNYSDDNGLSWSAQQTLTMPTLDALIPTSGGQVWGKIHPIDGGGIGFAFYTGNATHTQGRFVRSFDDGMTWDQHIIWPSSILPNALTETDSLYIGNGRLVACSRTDGTLGTRMFTSTDNGLTWADRGIGIYNSIRPPTLTKIIDDLGRTWALLTLAYGNSVFYSIAYADTLMAEGVSAWPYADYFSNGNGGMYATIILNETTAKGVMMVNYQATLTNSTNRVFNITASVNCTRAILNNLTVNAGCVAELESREWNLDFIISNQLTNYGEIIQNGKRLNITGSNETPILGYGAFDGEVYLNGSIASHYHVQLSLPMGHLHTDRDTNISIDATHYLRVIPSTVDYVSISIISPTRWTAEVSNSLTSVTFTVPGLDSTVGYRVFRDGVAVYQQFKGFTILTFTYSGPWSEHTFEVLAWDLTPSDNLQASFSYKIDSNMLMCTDQSFGPVTIWVWNFGDGTGSTKQSPSHKYIASGKYVISLTVYDALGHSSIAKTEIELKLGPDFPIERNPSGWNVFVTDDLTLSISAVGLLVGGAIMYVSAMFLPYFPVITPKGRKIIGAFMVLAGLYFLIFVDNSWMKF